MVVSVSYQQDVHVGVREKYCCLDSLWNTCSFLFSKYFAIMGSMVLQLAEVTYVI